MRMRMFFLLAIPLLLIISPSLAAISPYQAKLDIVLLIDRSGSIDTREYKKMLDAIQTLPEAFPIGRDASRVAIVAFDTNAAIEMPMTDNPRSFRQGIDRMRSKGTAGFTATNKGLNMVREDVLRYDQRKDVADIVIIFTDGCTNPIGHQGQIKPAQQEAENEAKMLRRARAIIFLVYIGNETCSEEHQKNLIGDSGNRVSIENFDDLLKKAVFEKFKEHSRMRLCGYKKICYYEHKNGTKQQCTAEMWRHPSAESFQCKESKPAPQECQTSECEEQCKEFSECDVYCTDTSQPVCVACESCVAENPNPAPKGQQGGGKEPGSDSEAVAPKWLALYIVMACFALLLILLLVILALFIVRGRREQRRQETEVKTLIERSLKEGRSHASLPLLPSTMQASNVKPGESEKPGDSQVHYETFPIPQSFEPTVAKGGRVSGVKEEVASIIGAGGPMGKVAVAESGAAGTPTPVTARAPSGSTKAAQHETGRLPPAAGPPPMSSAKLHDRSRSRSKTKAHPHEGRDARSAAAALTANEGATTTGEKSTTAEPTYPRKTSKSLSKERPKPHHGPVISHSVGESKKKLRSRSVGRRK